MKLLHPYMPFITEEIYRHLVVDDESIMISKWPVYREDYNFPEEEKKMSLIMDAIKSIRNIRAEMNVPHSRKAKAIFVAPGGSEQDILKEGTVFFERLASCSEVVIQPDKSGIPSNAVAAILAGLKYSFLWKTLLILRRKLKDLRRNFPIFRKNWTG